MKITAIRSDEVYSKLLNAPLDKKEDIYRYELMKPFQKKWDIYQIPLKASAPGGYDVIQFCSFSGLITPNNLEKTNKEKIALIANDFFWKQCQDSITKSLTCFTDNGFELPVQEYVFSVLLSDPQSPYVLMNDGYYGDGGIPGCIFAIVDPSEYSLQRLPAALAHETNHNVRFQFINWLPSVTLGDMIVTEGLAEYFATSLYGEKNIGPWVSKTDFNTLEHTIKPIIYNHLTVQGLENLNAYLYGDETAVLRNCQPVGLPHCAGYACGYHLIKHFLKKTGLSIIEATTLPAEEILTTANDFWS